MKIILSIIIVKYKSEKYLADCVESIGKNPSREVIIVDNDKENIGYSGGCNKGAKKAKGKYLLFLNPDTLILEDSLIKMIDYLKKNPSVEILGPRIYSNKDKEKQLSFSRFPDPITAIFVYSPLKNLFKENLFWRRFIYDDKRNSTCPFAVDAVSGAALIIRKEIFEKVDGFDERFFLYFEENDLCRRVQKLGSKIVFYPEAEIIHFGGKSTLDAAGASQYFRQSRAYFLKKYYGIIGLLTEALIRLFEFMSLFKPTN